jgi:GNAT superfamily N-acetyltransferase
LPYIGAYFGGKAIELAGRAVRPKLQGHGIGTEMLDAFLGEHSTEYLTTYTRNPAVLRMIGRVAHSLYPLDADDELQALAGHMPGATLRGNATYHMNRYAPGGLFRNDPALSTIATAPQTLQQRFSLLKSKRNALIITAKVKGDIK